MEKSENAWEDEEQFSGVWDYINENPRIMGLPLSENKGIDLLSALHDVYRAIGLDPQAARMLLTLLANVLVAAAQGDGEEVVEEVIVQEAMLQIDKKLKEIIDEG